MASDKHLRSGRPARAGRFALRRCRSPIVLLLGAATLVAAVVFVAAAQLAGVRGPKAYPEPAFLSTALGAPQASAPLVRRPAPGTEVRIERRSYAASRDGATVSLALDAADPTNWQARKGGVSRGTEFGGEAVKIGKRVAEQYLTVTSRRGRVTWRWKLDSGRLEPRVGDDGVVAFFDGLRLDDRLHVAPVAIFDRRGHSVTPKGLRWSLSRDGADWYLELRLDDSRLPLPYVIDPGIVFRSGGGTGTGASASITLPTPAGVQSNDILLAQITVRGGTGTSITPADGTWTALGTRQNSGATLGQEIYRHTGAPSSYQFNFGASVRSSGGVVVYRGVVTSSPVIAAAGQANGSSTSVTAPSINVGTTTNSVLVGFFGSATGTGTQGTDWAAPGGTTERFDNTATGSSAGNRTSSEGADETYAGSGATGTRTATNGAAAVNIGHLVALNPDATAPTANTVTLAETANPDSYPDNVTHTFWYRPASTTGGTFTVTEAPTEGQSGVQYVTFPALTGGFTPTSSTNDTTSPYVQTYTWPATTGTESGSKNVTVRDNADNVSAATTFTISADSTAPPAPAVTFPDSTGAGAYNATTWNAGCATSGLCGTATNDSQSGTALVELTIKRNGDGFYWNGTTFVSQPESSSWQAATGTTTWSYAFDATKFTGNGTYTVHVRATDNVANVTTNSTFTFVYDTTLPTSSADALPTNENTTTFNVTYTASDGTGSGLKDVELWVKGPSDSSYNLAATDTTPASPSFSYTATQGDGTYLFYTRAHDNATNYEAVPGTPPDTQTQLDTAKPTSSADALPSYESSTSFNVTYTASDVSGSGVKDVELWVKGPSDSSYSLAATDNTPASPSFSYTATQGDGTYRFYTRAHDNALNYEDVPGSPPDTQTLLDTTKPTSSADALPAYETSTGFTVTYTSADASGSGVKDVELWVKGPSDGSYNLVATDNTPASPSFSYTAGQGDGSYHFYTRAHDNALNYEDAPGSPPDTQTTLDTAAPDTSITAGPANPSNNANPNFSFTSTEPGTTFQCRLDGGSWASCTSPKSYSGLSEASHTFDVKATDAAGNTDASAASSTWTLDLTNPSSSLGFPGTASYNASGWNAGCGSSGLCGSASDGGGAGLQQVELSIKRVSDGKYWDGSGFNSASEDWRLASGTSSWSYAFPAASFPGDGDYTVRVRATDNAANEQSPASLTFTYENTPPETTIDSSPADPSNNPNPSFTFSAKESGSTFECRLDGAPWSSCSSPKSYTGLAQGSHTFDARATDTAGNTDPTPAGHTWTVDLTGPSSTVTFPSGSGQYGAGTWNAGCAPSGICGSASDSGGGSVQRVEVSIERVSDGKYWDGSGFGSTSEDWRTATGTTSWSYSFGGGSFPAGGDYTVRARGIDTAGNTESPSTLTFTFDTSAPTTTASVANPTGSTYWNGSGTVYYRPGGSGGFDLTATVADPDTGAQKAAFPLVAGFGAGGDVAAPGPYSSGYGYSGMPTEPGAVDVTGHNNAGLTSTASVTIAADSSAPSGGSVSYADGYDADGTVTITTDPGSDSGSGLDATSVVLERQTAPLSDGSCSGYGSWSTVTSPDTVADGRCAVYRFRVSDRVGNEKIYTSPNVVKVDQSGPTMPALDVSESSPLSFVSGTTLFYNPQGSNSGSFTVASTAGDPDSGIEKVVFPALAGMTGGGDDASSPYGATYDWTASSGAAGAQTVTNRNNAGLESTAQFTVTPDAAAPTGGSVSYPDGYHNGDVTITTSDGGDGAGSGVDASSGVLERALATLSGGGCGAYGPWTPATSPDSLPNARCAKYRYRVSDNVGNEAVYTSTNVIRTDNVFPTVTLGDPGANLRQTVAVGATANDDDSGITTVAFQRSDGSGGWTTIGTDSDGAPYTVDFDTTGAPDGVYDLRAIATDDAGNATTSDVVANRRVDNTPPSATMGNPGPYVRGTVTLASSSSDSGSGVASVAYELSPAGAGTWSSVPATWDTTATADGLYDLHVVVTDVAGNQTTSTAATNVRVDNTLPNVSVDNPGPYVTGTVSLSATASDAGSGIDTVSFEFRPAGGSWAPTPTAWDTSTLADGDYELRATATDRAGNSRTSASVATRVDNTDPTVAITTPTDGGYVNAGAADPFTVLADATDTGSGIDTVQFFECSDLSTGCATGTWTPLGTAASTPYQTLWSLPANGNRSLKATSTDNVGHTADAVIDVTIDRTRPDTTISGKPGDPSNVAAPDFSFDSSEPGSTFECQLDSGAFAACTSPETVGPLADGPHTFTARAIDAAGNVDDTPATWTWLVDTTLPTGAIDDPGDNLRGTVALTSTTDDPGGANASGVASVEYQYSADGGLTWATAPELWDTTTVPDGLYDLRVEVLDNAGNVFDSAPVTGRRVDNTPPATALDDPGANLRQTITLNASATDTGSGVADVTFQVAPTGSGAWTTIGSATGFPYTASFDTITEPDGLYDFRTVATDVAGNQVEGEPVTMRRIDNTPPAAAMTDPGAYLRGTVMLNSTTDDFGGSGISSVVYEYASAGSGSWQPGSAAWNTTTVSDGSYDLHVVVTDVAGNQTISGSVDGRLVDNTRPVTTDNAPSGWQRNAVTVSLSPSDSGSGVANTQFSVDGGGYSSGTSVTIDAPSDGSNDGAHTISYFSTDVAGNIESPKTASVAIDATPPVPGADDPGTYLRGTITLSANPSDDGAGIKSVEFQYSPSGSGSWTSLGVDTDSPYSAAFDTASVPDGAYDLRFIVTDESDNTTTQDLASKIVDNTAPSAAVGSPPNGSVVSGDVTVGATALDANTIVSVEFFVGGGSIGTATSPPFTRTWNSAGASDGPVSIHVVVTDIAGNSTTSSDITVTVDNHAPSVSMDSPAANVRGTVGVSASADADTAQVTFERRPAGGGGWTAIGTDTGAPWSAPFDTTVVPDGSYELRATAIDSGGNSGTSSVVTTNVDNTNPSGALTAPGGGATVGGSAIPLSAMASDGGSGVGSVTFQVRPVAGSWSDIASDGSAPFDGTWDATSLASGSYELRVLVTDAAGNTAGSTVVPVTVDSDAPGVTLEDPGAQVSGTITLRATTTGDAVSVTFAYSPAGGATWTTIGSDGSAPYSRSFNTASVPDGLYDFRAVVSDAVGNTSASVRAGIRLDNRAPEIISSVPEDGSVVAAASSIELTASEAIGGFQNVTLDGAATVAPVISGSQATFNTGALPNGPHTLAGTVKDQAGLTGSFSVHFVVGPLASGGSAAASASTVVPPPTNFRGTFGKDGTLTLRWTPAVDEDGEPLSTILYVNGAPVRTFSGTETSANLGPFDPSDPSTFAMVSINGDGDTSEETPTLRAVPNLVGKTVPEAADVLAVRGMTVGRVTGEGTVVKPSGPVMAAVGSAIDLQLSGPDGGPPATKLVLQVVTTKQFSWKVQKSIGARIKSTRPVTVTVTLLSRGGRRLYRWRLQLKAGATVVKLRMPPQVRRPGRYTLVFAGRAGNDTAKATARFRIVGPLQHPSSQPLEVVLAGDPKTRDDLAAGLGDTAEVVLADEDGTFDHAGSESENVQVAVIDVDQYGVGLVRDLHTVFPMLRIVALSDDPKKLAQSVKAGATVALPRSTPPDKLAEIIRRLARR